MKQIYPGKQHLFNRNKLSVAVAVACGLLSGHAIAADVDIGNGGAGSPTAGQTVGFTGSASNATGTATVADGVTIGAVTATNDRAGTLTFSGAGGAGAVGAITGNSIGVINAGANGKTVTFSGEVGSYNINVTGTGTVDFQDKVGGYINFGGGSGTVKLGNDLHEGTVTTSTNNTGILEFSGNSTIGVDTSAASGDIGTSSAKLNEVKITGGNVTANGNIFATSVTIGNTRTLNVATGKNITGTVDGAGAGQGTLTFAGTTTTGGVIGGNAALSAVNFNGGTVSIGHDIRATLITFANASSSTFTTAANLGASNLAVTGTASVGVGQKAVTTSGTINFGSGTTFKTELWNDSGTNKVGSLVSSAGDATVSATAKVDVNVTSTLTINDGTAFKIIGGAAGTAVNDLTTTVTDNSAVLSFTAKASSNGTTFGGTGKDLYLVASRVSGGYTAAASLPASSTAAAAANTLDTIAQGGTATGDMSTVINTFNSYNAATLASELKKAAPIVSTAATSATFGVSTGGLNTVATRLASVRGDVQMADSGLQTGLAAGDAAMSRHFWVKGFGAWNKAGMRDGFDGYKARSGGLSFGADTELPSGWTVGGAFTHAATAVDQQDARLGDSTKIKSYQLTGYAMKDFGPAYVDTMLSYARHNNATHRATALGRAASGDFDSDQWSARLAGGYRMSLGEKTQLVPLASLEWSTLKQKAYTETGAGALNLNYQGTTTDSLKLGLGARVSGEAAWGATAVIPEVHATAFHDFGDARTDTTASFTGGGAAFTTTGQTIQRSSYNVGGSLAFLTGRNSKITVGYDFEGRSGFQGHSAQIAGRWAF